MTTKDHCESSLGSFDEFSAAHKRLSTLRPSHLTWAVSPPVGSYRLQPPLSFIIITQPESWYSFTIPSRVEGWVDLGTAGKVHTARAQGCKLQWLCDKHNCPHTPYTYTTYSTLADNNNNNNTTTTTTTTTTTNTIGNEKVLRETQTLRAGCSKVESPHRRPPSQGHRTAKI